MRLRRRPFEEVVASQLALFATESEGLLRDCDAALRAYHRAGPEEAEERYGDYLDLVDTGREALEKMRDAYAETLDETAAEEYRWAFNGFARKRFPRFSLELD